MRDLDIQCCVSLTWQIRKTSRVPSWWHLLCKACHPSLVRAKLEIKTQAYLKYSKLYRRQNWFPHVMLRRNWQRPDKQLFCNCLYWKTQPTEMLRHFILSGLFSCSSSITWPFRHQFCCQKSLDVPPRSPGNTLSTLLTFSSSCKYTWATTHAVSKQAMTSSSLSHRRAREAIELVERSSDRPAK